MEKKMSWALLAVSAMWGSSYVVSKICFAEGMGEMEIIFYRFALGALLLGAIFFREIARMTKTALRTGLILGSLSSVAFAFEMYGLAMTEASKASFLTASNVVMMPFLYALICRTKLHARSVLAACIAMAGIGFLTLNGGLGGVTVGDLFLLCDAALYCVINIMIFKLCGDDSRIQITFVRFVTMAVFSFLVTAVRGFGGGYSATVWTAIGYSVLMPTTLCFILQTAALHYVNPMRAALIFSTESSFCTIIAMVLLHERPGPTMFIGMALILCGILVEVLRPAEKT